MQASYEQVLVTLETAVGTLAEGRQAMMLTLVIWEMVVEMLVKVRVETIVAVTHAIVILDTVVEMLVEAAITVVVVVGLHCFLPWSSSCP